MHRGCLSAPKAQISRLVQQYVVKYPWAGKNILRRSHSEIRYIYRLAQESGLSQTTISNIFKRNNQPSLPTVNAICDACGITLAQFFTENDPANSPNAKNELDNSVAALKEDQREALAAFIKTIV